MATKKSAKPKTISDISKPGASAATATSKAVIVNNRQILQDPMVVNEAADSTDTEKPSAEPVTVRVAKPKLKPAKPLTPTDDVPESINPEPQKAAPKVEAAKAEPSDAAQETADSEDKPAVPTQAEQEAAIAAQAKHDEAIQKLVESKKYALPVNTVEKRRTRRFVLLGVVLSLLLIVAWADIALDAGLIHIGNVKPVTHFFST